MIQRLSEAAETYAARATPQAVTQSTQTSESAQGQVTDAPSAPLLTRFCGACHRPELAAPRGSLYIDLRPQSRRVIAQELGLIRDWLLSDMPPAGSPQPAQGERQAMLVELQLLSQ